MNVALLLFCMGLELLLLNLVLWLSTKIFKIPTSFKTSFKIVFLFIVGGIGLAVVLAKLGALFGVSEKLTLLTLVNMILSFFVFNFLMQHYYQTSIGKNVGVYAVYIVFGVLVTILMLIPIISLRQFVVEPFVVSGNAMKPNFENGDYILLKKWNHKYERGDVIVMKYPNNPQQIFLKRIVGLPNETVTFQNGKVNINGMPLDESKYLSVDMQDKTVGKTEPVFLPANHYFVLGDNRTASSDSRVWGSVSANFIIGKYLTTLTKNK
jgi:signal peptidase I